MNICKIESIIEGKPWTSQHGTMHSFTVVFADGVRGEANAKTNPPPYKVGDKVGYEVAGQTPRGQNKLRIDRKADPSQCRDTTPPEAPDFEAVIPKPATRPPSQREQSFHTPTQNPVKSSQNAQERLPVNLPHGATVGASINKGVEIWLATDGAAGAPWDTKALNRVGAIARQLVHLAGQIERGEQEDESVPF